MRQGFAPGQPQALERLWRSHFVQQMAVDVEQRRAIVVLPHQMGFPELVVQGFAGHRRIRRVGQKTAGKSSDPGPIKQIHGPGGYDFTVEFSAFIPRHLRMDVFRNSAMTLTRQPG
jgi:hypothetical protein